MPAARERQPRRCEWIALADALKHFAVYEGRTQTQRHIKPIHWYVACRLEWSPESPALRADARPALDYEVRIAG